MLSKKHMLISRLLLVILFTTTVFYSHAVSVVTETEILDKYVFNASEDNLSKAQDAVEQAKNENQLAMVVLGAQWCHDSRALATQFSKPEMQAILNKEYKISFIDVGMLEDRREITSEFNYPHYFATPTVLIIDPHSGEVVNLETVSTWSNSAKLDDEMFVNKFKNPHAMLSNGGHQIISPILAEFEASQAQRLQFAYDILGPQLEADIYKTHQSPEAFYELWNEIRDFRFQLQADIVELRSIAPASLNQDKLNEYIQAKGSWE